VGAVVRADAVAQPAVAPRASEPLDPGVLVERHRLTGELAAEPARLLDQHDARAAVACRERRGDTTQPAADDEHLRSSLAHRATLARMVRRAAIRLFARSTVMG
jgi:hypothetical protein